MSKELTEKEKHKVRTLYQLLSINKEAGTRYLVDTGPILKLEDTAKRKQTHKKNMDNLLKAIE